MDNKYLSNFQIVGNSVKELNIKNSFVTLGYSESAKRTLDISHEIKEIETIDDNGGIQIGTLLLHISFTVSEKKEKYKLNLTMEGCFSAPKEMKEEDFNKMIKLNGVATLYSISRAFVQSVSAQTLASGNVLLPMINVLEYSKDVTPSSK